MSINFIILNPAFFKLFLALQLLCVMRLFKNESVCHYTQDGDLQRQAQIRRNKVCHLVLLHLYIFLFSGNKLGSK